MQPNLAKVLLLGDEINGYIRYEIFSKEGERPDYPEKIAVYREKVLDANGDKYWAKTDDIIRLDYLGFQNGGFQMSISPYMRPNRDIFSAIEEGKKHYRKTY